MDKFCSFCGVQHTAETYPKHCTACNNTTWKSPKPVSVLLQPVVQYEPFRVGVLIGRRKIQPKRGEFGLIGGYVDPTGENVIDAARREYWEEMGKGRMESPASGYSMVSSFSDGNCLLIFVECEYTIPLEALEDFVPNHECDEIRVAWEPETLCFQSHTDALAEWFERHKAA